MTQRPDRTQATGAFLGLLVGLNPRSPGETMLATVALPRGEYDAAIRTLGVPDSTLGPNVVLLPSLRPAHPFSDDDAVLLAAMRLVRSRLPARSLRSELRHELDALRVALAPLRPRRDITRPVSDASFGMLR